MSSAGPRSVALQFRWSRCRGNPCGCPGSWWFRHGRAPTRGAPTFKPPKSERYRHAHARPRTVARGRSGLNRSALTTHGPAATVAGGSASTATANKPGTRESPGSFQSRVCGTNVAEGWAASRCARPVRGSRSDQSGQLPRSRVSPAPRSRLITRPLWWCCST